MAEEKKKAKKKKERFTCGVTLSNGKRYETGEAVPTGIKSEDRKALKDYIAKGQIMAVAVVKDYEVYIDGGELSGAFKSYSINHEQSEVDSTHLDSSGYRGFLPGLKSSTLALDGSFDYDETNTDAVDNILQTAYAAQSEVIVTFGDATIAAGGLAIMADGPPTNYEISGSPGELGTIAVAVQNDGAIGHGSWIDGVMDLSTNTVNSASLDNSASSANGGIFHAHLILESDSTASAGGTSVTLEHSTNDSTWADLVASQAWTSKTHGGISNVVARGTTVNRYLRFTCTSDGVAHVVAAFYRFA